MKQIVILGAGTAGTMMSNKLRRILPNEWSIALVDRDNRHIYQPGLLFVPFGMYRPDEIERPRHTLVPPGVDLLFSPISMIDPFENLVIFESGARLRYDILIVATGTRLVPEETEGLTGPGWGDNIFDFYTLEGASNLAAHLERFRGGHLVVNVVDMPIKCPVAPLEFLFLAEAFFTQKGIRDKVKITYATPLDAAFTKPVASRVLGDMLAQRDIHLESNFSVSSVDGSGSTLRAYDGRELGYDTLVTVPLHAGSALMSKSGLGDDDGFVPTHKHTLQTKAFKNIFALGDATDLPTSKAGSVAHFQAEVLVDNIVRYIADRPLEEAFDGHANCFIETGHDKAILIDFNYDTEPLPGRFPLPGIGPFTLLEESHVNHWGKLGFRWIYWNVLVRGEELPMDHRMAMAGKWR
jgi:sulfide:quinone oxidoreductase